VRSPQHAVYEFHVLINRVTHTQCVAGLEPTFSLAVAVEEQEQQGAERGGGHSPGRPEELHDGTTESQTIRILTAPPPPRSDPEQDGDQRRETSPEMKSHARAKIHREEDFFSKKE